MESLDLIYIGERFYRESGSIMSSLYTHDGMRSDFGAVQMALKAGMRVTIEQATQEEIGRYQQSLDRMKAVKNNV